MMGRVMSMYSLVFFVAMPIGYVQSGAITTRFGTQASLVGGGARRRWSWRRRCSRFVTSVRRLR